MKQPMTTLIKTRTKPMALVATGALLLATAPLAADDFEVEDRGPYYEDDAWYDISEWLDGNDYNPTDEVIGRWDDEQYQRWQDLGTDQDNDDPYDFWDDNSYGFDNDDDSNDWFYDFYDNNHESYSDYQNDGVYDFAYLFFDYDGDGRYDAQYNLYDWNSDGKYEDVSFYAFNKEGQKSSNQKKSERQMSKSSKQVDLQGSVRNVKTVKVQNGKHLVAMLETKDGKRRIVDLGPKDALDSTKLKKGDTLRVRGPVTRVGDRKVLTAKWMNTNGTTKDIQRSSRELQGTVENTRTVKVRGEDHLIAVIQRNGKTTLVDLGPKNRLGTNLSKGDTITVHGVPCKVDDKPLVMATALEMNGSTMEINRRMEQRDRQRSRSSRSRN